MAISVKTNSSGINVNVTKGATNASIVSALNEATNIKVSVEDSLSQAISKASEASVSASSALSSANNSAISASNSQAYAQDAANLLSALSNVDNTSDLDKPVSNATQTALNLKANLASPTFTGTVSGISKSMVGLANVDNTADSAKVVASAAKLTTARTINGELFDGTADIMVATKKVDMLYSLRTITEAYETVWVSGYHAKNDGAFGSHIFRLKGIKTTETDNGGTVIIATISGTDYVYELQFDGAVNVKWFGAKGNRITNDLTSVQNALYYIRSMQDISTSWYSDKVDSILLFTDGTYLIDGTVLTPGNVTIRGDGASIISNNNDTTPVFETCYIDSGVWTSNASLPVNTLLEDAVTNLKFENLTFRGISYVFKLRGAIWQSHISNCSFYYCGVVVTANNCFYFNYLDIRVYGTKGAQFDSVARFQLSESVNRISFDRLSIGLISSVGTDGGIGISVTGGGSNLSVTNSSLEEMNKGITFTGTFNDFKINSTYVEGVKTVLETDNAIKRGFDIDIPTGFLIHILVVGSGFRNTVIKPYQDRLATTENYRGIINLTAGTNGNRGTIVYMDSSYDNTIVQAVKYQVTADVELVPQDWQLQHGVNANGTYVKHPNGVLIQHISKVIAYTANTNTTVILPISFKDSKFSLSFKMTAFSGYDSDIVFGDNGNGSFVLRSKNTHATNYFDITAIGRWK